MTRPCERTFACIRQLRAEYPVRREFFNTELVLRGASEELQAKFAALGFKMG